MKEIAIGILQSVIAIMLLVMLAISWKRNINIKNLKNIYLCLVLCLVYWLFANAMRSFSEMRNSVLFWYEAKYIGILPLPSLILAFSLIYTKKDSWLSNKKVKYALIIIPVIFLMTIVTDPYLHLFREKLVVVYVRQMTKVIPHNNLFFWLNTFYTYLMIIISIILLTSHCYKLPKYYRFQPIVLIIALLPPFLLNITYVFSILDEVYDQTTLAFVVTGLIFHWALFYFSTPEIIPVARQLIIENMQHLLIVTDINGKVVDLNLATKEILKSFNINIMNASFEESFQKFIESTDGSVSFSPNGKEMTLHFDGDTHFYSYNESPILEKGETIGYLNMFNDITEVKTMMHQLENIATVDPLTNLRNRIYLDNNMHTLDDKSKLPITVFKGGLNGLKMINDSLGNEIGDQLIIRTADILREVFSDQGLIARVSGDEFVIILPQTNATDAKQYTDRILELCNATLINHAKLSLCLSHSTMTNSDELLADHMRLANNNMYRKKLTESQSTRSSIIESLKTALEQSDYETQAHAERTQKLALEVGRNIGLSDSQLNDLSMLSVLHDIGKLSIPDHILLKPSKLTKEEFEIIKTHTEKGYAIAIASPELVSIAKGILHHHERWDGNGYPSGIARDQIPIEARVITIVDAYDVMTNDRPYHKAISKEEAIEELKRCKGTQFDPDLVEVLLEILNNH
ncbi:histidine kinase N-terminal 7TM domain-containing protein [Vallitalea okinawensis]|uniref:histidine kinase N-terminal 7TM domain-containing protein n=1 Tax=Vallitalea okinawensis TaxID=2078660 RepID=UPI000CFC3F01|nr:HD domain-containing phosphohydrolase [Vallitalea okinawensis]